MADTNPKETAPPRTAARKRVRARGPAQRKAAGEPRPPGKPPAAATLAEDLAATLGMVGMTVGLMLDPVDGMIIVAGAPALADALVELAERNPAVKKMLTAIVSTSAYGGVAMALVGITVPILANHKIIPAEFAAGIGHPLPDISQLGADPTQLDPTMTSPAATPNGTAAPRFDVV